MVKKRTLEEQSIQDVLKLLETEKFIKYLHAKNNQEKTNILCYKRDNYKIFLNLNSNKIKVGVHEFNSDRIILKEFDNINVINTMTAMLVISNDIKIISRGGI